MNSEAINLHKMNRLRRFEPIIENCLDTMTHKRYVKFNSFIIYRRFEPKSSTILSIFSPSRKIEQYVEKRNPTRKTEPKFLALSDFELTIIRSFRSIPRGQRNKAVDDISALLNRINQQGQKLPIND